MRYTCGYCLFAEETEDRSSDELWCPIKKTHLKINEYPCAKWRERKGLFSETEDGWPT